jgi:hypothetical protein
MATIVEYQFVNDFNSNVRFVDAFESNSSVVNDERNSIYDSFVSSNFVTQYFKSNEDSLRQITFTMPGIVGLALNGNQLIPNSFSVNTINSSESKYSINTNGTVSYNTSE